MTLPIMNTNKPQAKENSCLKQQKTLKNKQSPKEVRQDKHAFQCVRTALCQPVTVKNPLRTRRLFNSKPRSQKSDVDKKRSIQTTLYLKPIVCTKLRQYASERGVSLNQAGAALLEKGVRDDIARRQIELLKPVIENTIAKKMQETCEILEAVTDRLLTKKQIHRKN